MKEMADAAGSAAAISKTKVGKQGTKIPSVNGLLLATGLVLSFLSGYLWPSLVAYLAQQSGNSRTSAGTAPSERGWAESTTHTSSCTSNAPCTPLSGHMKRLGAHRRPSVDIPVIDHLPNAVDFYERFIRRRQPVLIRGAIKSMPAFRRWKSKSYLKKEFGDTLLKVEMRKVYDTHDFEKSIMKLSEFLERYEKEDLYMDTPLVHSRMLNDVTVPMCMDCPELKDSVVSSHLLFSSGNTSSSYHFDGLDNLFMLMSGRKQFIVMENKYMNYSYFDDHKLHPVISPINPEAVDLVKYPHFQHVEYGVVNVEQGDLLYNPSMLPHHVRSVDSPNIAVNIWFAPFSYEESVRRRLKVDPDKEVVLFHTELHKTMLELAPKTLECNERERRLYDVLQNSSAAEISHLPDEKANASLPPLILNTGYEIPRIGFGTPTGEDDEVGAAYTAALNAGYRMIDSAEVYDTEDALGKALSQAGIARDQLFLVSKVSPAHFTQEGTVRAVDRTLARLKTSYIDLMLLHAKNCSKDPTGRCLEGGLWQDGWQGLETAVAQGKVRSIGVSNFESVEELEEVVEFASVNLSVVQNLMDPFNVPHRVLEYCRRNGIVFMGYSTLGGPYIEEGLIVNPVLKSPVIKDSVASRQCTPAEFVLRWAMQMGIVVIPSTSNPVHMAINLHAVDIQLDEQEMRIMSALEEQDPLTGEFRDPASAAALLGEVYESVTKNYTPAEKEGGMDEQDGAVIASYNEVDVKGLAVFAGGDDGLFTAFNGSSGEILWQYQTYNEFGSSCVFSPDHTKLYFASENRRVYCLEVCSGERVWSATTSHSLLATPQLSLDSSLLLVGNLGTKFYAIDRASGAIVWEKQLPGTEIWSTAAIGRVAGKEVVVVGTLESGMHALHVKDGSQLWHVAVVGGVWSSPVWSPGHTQVFFGGQDGRVYCVAASTGDLRWSWQTRGKVSPSLTLHDDAIYGASDQGALFALNAESGTKLWKVRLGSPIVSSPKMTGNGILVIGAQDKTIRGYDSSTGKRLWKYITGHEVWSSAAISKSGVAFVGGVDKHMYALNSTTGALVWRTRSSEFAASPCISPQFRH